MTSDFKQVLEVRSENLRESKSRREQFSQGAVTHSMPQMDGYPNGSVLATAAMDDDEAAAAAAQSNGEVSLFYYFLKLRRKTLFLFDFNPMKI